MWLKLLKEIKPESIQDYLRKVEINSIRLKNTLISDHLSSHFQSKAQEEKRCLSTFCDI